jgi:hypothetical protein
VPRLLELVYGHKTSLSRQAKKFANFQVDVQEKKLHQYNHPISNVHVAHSDKNPFMRMCLPLSCHVLIG